MLAADRMLLETNLKQRAIKLREKELNLFTDNFSALGTQAAVLAGFTTTCFIEISIPETTHVLAKSVLHLCAVVSICSNITCVSLSTIVSVWGSGTALRGKDGSMDEAVDGMSEERSLIFRAFGLGLLGNLSTVMSASWILMDPPLSIIATFIVGFTGWLIATNFLRIRKKFQMTQITTLEDLTNYNKNIHHENEIRSPVVSTDIKDQGRLVNRKFTTEIV